MSTSHKVWDKAKELEWLSEKPHIDIHKWIRKLGSPQGNPTKQEQTIAGNITWSIWKSRNNVAFREEKFNINKVLFRARSSSKEWEFRNKLTPEEQCTNHTPSRKDKTILVRWKTPPLGCIKINFDGSVRGNQATSGYVIRNFAGKMIQAGVTKLATNNVLLAEVMGLRNGVQAAFEMGFRILFIEGDNICVIQALEGEIPNPWSVDFIIRDTRSFLSNCCIVNINHIYREGNRAANWIANEGHKTSHSFTWSSSPSLQFDDILRADSLGMTLERRAS